MPPCLGPGGAPSGVSYSEPGQRRVARRTEKRGGGLGGPISVSRWRSIGYAWKQREGTSVREPKGCGAEVGPT